MCFQKYLFYKYIHILITFSLITEEIKVKFMCLYIDNIYENELIIFFKDIMIIIVNYKFLLILMLNEILNINLIFSCLIKFY